MKKRVIYIVRNLKVVRCLVSVESTTMLLIEGRHGAFSIKKSNPTIFDEKDEALGYLKRIQVERLAELKREQRNAVREIKSLEKILGKKG